MHNRIPVGASVIAAVVYSPEATLDIAFTSGAKYRYFAVPAHVFHEFLSADSKGGVLQPAHQAQLSMHEARCVTVEDHRYPITDRFVGADVNDVNTCRHGRKPASRIHDEG